MGMVCDGQRSQQTVRMVTEVVVGGDLWDPVPGTVPSGMSSPRLKPYKATTL